MKPKTIILKAQVESVSTRKDRTIKLSFSTQELKGADAAALLDLQNELVTLGINPKGLDSNEIQLLKDARFGIDNVPSGKSEAQMLRAVIYLNWKQNTKALMILKTTTNTQCKQLEHTLKTSYHDNNNKSLRVLHWMLH